ncbi:hypothetical protein NEMIN01_1573 [Nematocida minor]|uniref:uncharacterized protein n=1 Tax=Nematocida minor TaxID=1912983 RepID=UPI0022201B0E|nr:uncharacterized protein NEMIN01_1573 [Nematocida minor]KAI5191589.1 hypothetical protein NEMIN01_1573 [Nematocida minor]
MILEKKEPANSETTFFPIILDKLLAINSFFLIWIITAYVRWKFYFSFLDAV